MKSPAYKNFWSLNTDEAVVTGILRSETEKHIEILMPLNAQMKGVDLVLMNTENKKALTIQVKGSRAYEPKKSEAKKFGAGSTGWFFLSQDVFNKASADYFIFLIYVIQDSPKTGRRNFEAHTITIPTQKIQTLCKKYKKPHPERYSFYFWVNPETGKAFDFRDNDYDVSEYLDKKGFEKLNSKL